MQSSGEGQKKRPLPATVRALGWVSFFTDAGADMVGPLVPALLSSLGAGSLALGTYEGVAEATASLVKYLSGGLADRSPRKKPLIALGYTLSGLVRPLFALATLPLHVIAIRALDRIGKGLRGPPRDALVASLVPSEDRGRAFAFVRALDNTGGALGPVLAFALLALAHVELRTVFLLSVIPSLASTAVVLLAVREPDADAGPAPTRPLGRAHLPSAARRYLAAVSLFALASSGDLFLLRWLETLGAPAAYSPLAWLVLQLLKAIANVPGGALADRHDRRRVLAGGFALYAASYLCFALCPAPAWVWLALAPYAAHYGLVEGAERALLGDLVPAASRGRAFGADLAIRGALGLLANLGFGLAWDALGPRVAFLGAAALALSSSAALLALVPRRDAAPRAQ